MCLFLREFECIYLFLRELECIYLLLQEFEFICLFLQDLENERRKAVEANIEQMTSLRKIREEAMDTKKADLDAAVENMEKVFLKLRANATFVMTLRAIGTFAHAHVAFLVTLITMHV